MEIKIWSTELYRTRQRGIVAAQSQKHAVEILNEYGELENLFHFQAHAYEGGPLAQDVAAGRGEGLWVTKKQFSVDAKDWKRVIGKDPEGFKPRPRAKRVTDDDIIENHASYGMIGVTKGQESGKRRFFGSGVKSHNAISIRIHKAEVQHSLSRDSYFERECIIEVDMTPMQFLDLFTSPNQGSGVPCTIRYTREDGRLPEVPKHSKSETEKIADEFNRKAEELGATLESLTKKARETLSAPGTLKKKDKEDVLDAVESFTMQIKNNLPFLLEQMQESAQRTVSQAKAEVTAFADDMLQRKGLEAFKKDAPQLDAEDPKN
jgi:hypothetical protein